MIQLQGHQAAAYREYLSQYRSLTGKEPGPIERTEAFFCAISSDPWDRPSWIV